MKLIEFKENKTHQIIVTDKGKNFVDEKTFSNFYWNWLTHPKAIRADKDGFTVFGFTEPVDYDSFLKEGERIIKELKENNS